MSDGNLLENALMVLAAVAEYDHRFQGMPPEDQRNRAEAWAAQLHGRGLSTSDLLEGVRRAYSTPDRPLNPIGSILTEARVVRNDRRQRDQAKEITAGEKRSVHGDPLPRAYAVDGAIDLQCPACAASPGRVCEDGRLGVRRIPHVPRLALAYRTNNPEGRQRAASRSGNLRMGNHTR